jgi:hypothetical protein
MGLGKQAKTLSKGQVDAVLGYLDKTRWPTRNRLRLIFLPFGEGWPKGEGANGGKDGRHVRTNELRFPDPFDATRLKLRS